MHWLFDYQGKKVPPLSSAAVDCEACQVRSPWTRAQTYKSSTKCCEFSPFVSRFAVGALLRQGADLQTWVQGAAGELMLTRFGLLHSHKHRLTEGRLCRFFDQQSGRCGIWTQRPATCFSFFCVSEAAQTWQSLEMELLNTEAELLREWHFAHQGTEEEWALWGQIMEPRPLVEMPQALLYRCWEEAATSYRASHQWLQQRRSDRSPC